MSSLAKIPTERRCKQLVHQLLTKKTTCQVCNGKLSWKREYGWCRICRTKVRPKAATWLRGSKLTYRQTFVLLHCWQTRQSPGSTRLATGLSYTTIARWYWRFRAILPKESDSAAEPLLSGIVEVDEAYFGKKRFGGQTIVIGAIERDTRRLRLQVIPDTEQDSLEGFLEQHITRSSLVVTDCHAGYNDIEFLGFEHESWNHSKGHFAGTNHIEGTWSELKRYLRKLYGCIPTKKLQLVLAEWMARHNSLRLFASPLYFLQVTCSGLVD